MQRIRWYRLLFIGVLAAPITGRAQTPQPKIREIATMPGMSVSDAVLMPNRRVILYATYDAVTGSVFAYDLATKRSTLVTRGFDGSIALTRAGDRIAYDHESEDRKTDLVWSIPIDPATGAPTGSAQRVSMGPGNTASFSPDGKLIAFEVHRTRTQSDLVVVPTGGGVQRVVASFETGIGESVWSADGKSILVRVGGGPGKAASIRRIALAGGRDEALITFIPAASRFTFVGGGQVTLYRKDARSFADGRLAYQTISGAQGELTIPAGAGQDGSSGIEWTRTLLIKAPRPSTAHLLNLADGSVRNLLPGSVLSREAAWSPDGSQISVQDSSAGHWAITVMNADGSHSRRYPVPSIHPVMNLWSPSGRAITYMPNATSLAVLDLTTGKSTVVSSVRPGTAWGVRNIIWRPDGKSIVLVRDQATGVQEVYEATLDGVEHPLRQVDGPFAGYLTGGFVSDRVMIVGSTIQPNTQVLLPIDSGPPHQLPLSHRMPWFGISNDGKQLVFLVRNADGSVNALELMNSRGDSLRTISLPFEVDRRTIFPPFHPDGHHVALVGSIPGDTASRIFLVPFDGTAPRMLATLSGTILHGSSRLDLSPDGKSLVFTTEGAPTSTIYELDLSPLFQAVVNH